jgi:hypothetical protein
MKQQTNGNTSKALIRSLDRRGVRYNMNQARARQHDATS